MNEKVFVMPADADGANRQGVIYAANDSRFVSSHLSESLTTFVSGMVDKDPLEQLLNEIAPPVLSPRRGEFHRIESASAFVSETDDVRAIGSAFKRVEFTGETADYSTKNKGLTTRLDKDGEAALPGAKERAVRRLVNRLFRNELRRALTVLRAGATKTTVVWDTDADPIMDMMDAIDRGGDKRGVDSNRGLIGRGGWARQMRVYRGKDTPAAGAQAIMTPQQVADLLGLDRLTVASARYQESASAKAKLVGKYAIFYYAEDTAGMDDASNLKRFYTPTPGGMYQVYEQDAPKWIDITVEHYSNIIATSTLGIEELTIVDQKAAA